MTEPTSPIPQPEGAYLKSMLLQKLADMDPCFPEEQRQFQLACANLKESVKEASDLSVEAYLSSLDTLFSTKLLYIAWQGVSWNLDCFRNPVAKLRLGTDYEDLHGEFFFHAIPQIRAAEAAVSANTQRLPPCAAALVEKIGSYYAYLETVGFKITHDWGYLWANDFLPKVIPGYVADPVFTARYAHMLERDLGIDLANRS